VSRPERAPTLAGYLMFAAGLDLAVSVGACLIVAAFLYREHIIYDWNSDTGNFAADVRAALVLSIPVLLGGLLALAGIRKRGHAINGWRRTMLVAFLFLSTAGLFVGAWIALYPPGDPKNMGYTLWKAGLYSIDPADASKSVMEDPGRGKVLLGKTEDELRAEFGYLVPLARASQYFRICIANSQWQGADGAFIRDSDLMIVFKNGKSIDYLRVKGC